MSITSLTDTFDRIDVTITRWLARHAITLLRISIGIIFIWFGALKLAPGLSPAEDLVLATLPWVPPMLALPGLALWEIMIGLGFVSGRYIRATLLLLFMQMGGTLLPLITLPERTFTHWPIGLTLEGQYIIKNIVLIAAALVIGATARGGRMTAEQE